MEIFYGDECGGDYTLNRPLERSLERPLEHSARLDVFLAQALKISRSQAANLIKKNLVFINGAPAQKCGILLNLGDKITLQMPRDSADSPRFAAQDSPLSPPKDSLDFPPLESGRESVESAESRPESFPQIARIYEDEDVLVINKPPNLATHGAPSLKEKSLVDWLKAQKIQLSTLSGEIRAGIVHRLDKDTSGAMIIAKNNATHAFLSAQLQNRTMSRLYLALIDLPLKSDTTIECHLARSPKNRLKIAKVGESYPSARYAKSSFFKLLLSKDEQCELILAKLFTGRTHQIRAHLETINRHILGDELYGYKSPAKSPSKNAPKSAPSAPKYRVQLHSFALVFTHPKLGRMSLFADLLTDSREILERLFDKGRLDEVLFGLRGGDFWRYI